MGAASAWGALGGVAWRVAAHGVAPASERCPPGTHLSHGAFYVTAALSVMATVAVVVIGARASRAADVENRVAAWAVTALGAAVCAFAGFWVSLFVGFVLGGCVSG